MSIREAIVNNIVEGISTKEPLYKFTIVFPEIQRDGDYSHICCIKRSIIWNKSTYLENYNDREEYWDEIIDKDRNGHELDRFGLEGDFGWDSQEEVYLIKLSVELIN